MQKSLIRIMWHIICIALIFHIIPSISMADDIKKDVCWELYDSKYESDEYVIAGCTVFDFGAKGDGVTDDTKAFQAAIDYMQQLGGGTVFVPEGRYVIKTYITIKQGTMLVGEVKKSVKGEAVQGTIIMPYGGRNNSGAMPCITMQQMSACRDMIFWYPEQKADSIVPYPPTILMGDKTQWGDQYCDVENVEFVNSYIGFKKSNKMSGCPMVRSITGSPLKAGIIIDSLADVGRIESVDFSPVYWETSGLPDAPDKNDAHRDFMYTKGVAVEMHRNDWSYGRYLSAEGYYAGFYTLNSYCEEAWDGEKRIKDQYPNGENYNLRYKGCYIGIAVENTANAGVVFTDTIITDCENGVVLNRNFNSKLNLINCSIDANEYAFLNEGTGVFMGNDVEIKRGKVSVSSGYASFMDSDFNNKAPQLTYGKYSGGSVLGCRFGENQEIENASTKTVIIDNTPIETEKIPDFPYMTLLSRKPARNAMYNAMEYGAVCDGVTNDGVGIQRALNAAKADGGGVVFLPSGFYTLKTEINVPTGVELRGSLDSPQQPIRVGTTIEVYAGEGREDGNALITLEENSIIRGMCFDYPNQDYKNPIKYPFTIRGNGQNVSIINVSSRMAYSFIDLYTNKCDNAYCEYVSGHSWRRGIFVGGGSENCIISNTQFNFNTVNSGFESKWGSWQNGPTKGTTDAEKEQWQIETKDIEGYMKKNYEAFWIGDAKDVILYNNFVFPGGIGLTLTRENNNAPTGISLGYGSDNSRIAFLIDDIGDGGFDFINSQLVGVTSHDLVPVGIQTTKNFDKKITLFGCAIWGSVDSFTNLNGSGSVEIQGCNYASSIKRDFVVNNGELKIFCSKINKYSEKLLEKNMGTVSVVGCNYQKTDGAEIAQNQVDDFFGNIDMSSTTYVRVKQSALKEFIRDETINVKVGSGTVSFLNTAPFMENDTIYVPIRELLEKLGYPIEVSDNEATLRVESTDKNILISDGSVLTRVDGYNKEMIYPAKSVGGTLCVPSEFITKAIGSQIDWNQKTRTLSISIPQMPDTPKDSTKATAKLNIYAVSATGEETANPAICAADGNMSTRWAAEGAHSITFDLGSMRIIESLKIAFNVGNQRVYPFTVEMSEDGENWSTLMSEKNSGKSDGLEEYKILSTGYGRYLRFNGEGSNANKWNSILEFEIYGK